MFWKQFYALCVKANVSPNSLAQELGISSGSVTNWKNGGTPNGEMLIKIADRLGCSIDYMLDRTTSPQSPEFFRLLISDKGISAIKKPLAEHIKAYGLDQLSADTGIDFKEIKQFLDLKPPYDYKCTSMLDTILIVLETNLYDLLKENFYNELYSNELYRLISQLDDTDKAKLSGRVEQMLESDKYNKTSVSDDIAAEIQKGLSQIINTNSN